MNRRRSGTTASFGSFTRQPYDAFVSSIAGAARASRGAEGGRVPMLNDFTRR